MTTPSPFEKIACLLTIEPALLYTGWVASGQPNLWYRMVDINEPAPERFELSGILVPEAANLIEVQTTENRYYRWPSPPFYWQIFLHTEAGVEPDDEIALSYTTERFASHSPIVFASGDHAGKYWEPRIPLGGMPAVSYSMGLPNQPGARQSLGAIKLANGDGYFDARLANYIYEAKSMAAYAGRIVVNADKTITALWADFVCFWRGSSGKITWTDEDIEIETADLLKSTI